MWPRMWPHMYCTGTCTLCGTGTVASGFSLSKEGVSHHQQFFSLLNRIIAPITFHQEMYIPNYIFIYVQFHDFHFNSLEFNIPHPKNPNLARMTNAGRTALILAQATPHTSGIGQSV